MKLKKIRIQDLQVGMFIVNLGRSWFSHPFLRNQLKITSEKQVQKLLKYGIQEVYIDPERGMDLPDPEVELAESGESVPEDKEEILPLVEKDREEEKEEVKEAKEAGEPDVSFEQMEKPESVSYWERNIGKVEGNLLSMGGPAVAPSRNQVPYGQEIKSARIIQKEAYSLVQNIMFDVRMGRSIESDWVKRIVNNMVDSILRNSDALLSLTRIKRHDEYTFVHSLDVCIFCLSFARHLSFSRDEMLEFGIGALLHDVGKMKIPAHILHKPDSLSAEDWVEVRKHPVYSLEIMEASKGIPPQSKQLALQHHERYNGSGYPFGLAGDSIGIFGQLAGIVDFYDAITSDRAYQKAIPPHEGIRQIYERSQLEFNRLFVERFIQCIGIHPFGTLVLLDTEELGIVCEINSEILLRPKVLIIYRNSKTPYAQPFQADLTEQSEKSHDYRRTIIMPLDPRKWNIHTGAYLSDIQNTLNVLRPS